MNPISKCNLVDTFAESVIKSVLNVHVVITKLKEMVDSAHGATNITYDAVALSIFATMAFVFLFPCNKLIPVGMYDGK